MIDEVRALARQYLDDGIAVEDVAEKLSVDVDELRHVVDGVEKAQPSSDAGATRDAEPDADVEPDSKKSISTQLVELARGMFRFSVDETGNAFAVPRQGPRVTYMLRGGRSSLRKQLAREFFTTTGKAAPQQALADALLVIEGYAQDGREQVLHLRTARADGAWWLDMGDQAGRAIRVTGDGWNVEQTAPVLFRRTELTGVLPDPVFGGDIDELWLWLNVDPADRPIVLAWLIAALMPNVPHPVLGLFGEQGTGKTTAQKVLVQLLDPGPVPVRKAPRDADAWVTAAAGSWVVGLDNLSDVPSWLSDSICRAVTVDGDVRRKLYTDGALSVFAYRRAVIVNGIDLGAVRGDLADRMLPVHLHRIDDTARRDEDDYWSAWHEAHPRMLAAVLREAASVTRVLPSVRLGSKPRMADFARVLAAVDRLHGTAGLEHYVDKQRSLASESLTADAFITRLLDLGKFTGTAAELLHALMPTDDGWKPPRGWPANPRAVTQRLRRQAPVMRKTGWTIEDDGGQNRRNAIVWTVRAPTTPASDASQDPIGEITGKRHSQARMTREPTHFRWSQAGTAARDDNSPNSHLGEDASQADSPNSHPRNTVTSVNTDTRESREPASHVSGSSLVAPTDGAHENTTRVCPDCGRPVEAGIARHRQCYLESLRGRPT